MVITLIQFSQCKRISIHTVVLFVLYSCMIEENNGDFIRVSVFLHNINNTICLYFGDATYEGLCSNVQMMVSMDMIDMIQIKMVMLLNIKYLIPIPYLCISGSTRTYL